MLNILFAFAHPDDETFGPAGTIRKMSELGHQVWVLSLCKGDRPGWEWVEDNRRTAFYKACGILGANAIIGDASDVHLDYHYAVNYLSDTIKRFNIEVVYTHSTSDLHVDHRTVAEAALVACRPKVDCTVNTLYMCESSINWATGKLLDANTWNDITKYIELKRTLFDLYDTETYKYPDPRSVESMEAFAAFRGTQMGSPFAEAFQLVFSHDRKI